MADSISSMICHLFRYQNGFDPVLIWYLLDFVEKQTKKELKCNKGVKEYNEKFSPSKRLRLVLS